MYIFEWKIIKKYSIQKKDWHRRSRIRFSKRWIFTQSYRSATATRSAMILRWNFMLTHQTRQMFKKTISKQFLWIYIFRAESHICLLLFPPKFYFLLGWRRCVRFDIGIGRWRGLTARFDWRRSRASRSFRSRYFTLNLEVHQNHFTYAMSRKSKNHFQNYFKV